jgi:hypothetical protein
MIVVIISAESCRVVNCSGFLVDRKISAISFFSSYFSPETARRAVPGNSGCSRYQNQGWVCFLCVSVSGLLLCLLRFSSFVCCFTARFVV